MEERKMRVKSWMRTEQMWQKSGATLPQMLSLSSHFFIFLGLQAKRKKSQTSSGVAGHIRLSLWIRPLCTRRPTSHLLLQAQYDLDSLLQDDKLGLSLVALQVDLTHSAQFSESFVDVAHANPLPCVVS